MPGCSEGEAVSSDGEGDLVFIAEVHERAERKALRRRELHGPGGDAGGQRPGDVGRLAGVAGVDPVDVPVLFDGEDEAGLEGAADGDLRDGLRRERGELDGEVLGLDGAGAAVADLDDLCAGGAVSRVIAAKARASVAGRRGESGA